MNTNKTPAVREARRTLDDAEAVLGRKRGELLATLTVNRAAVPTAVRVALDDFECAENDAFDARERVRGVREAALTPAEADERRELSRISALIAVHVMGFRLAAAASAVYPWRVIDERGKTRELANYTGDASAIAMAESQLYTAEQKRTYGRHLEAFVAPNGKSFRGDLFHAVATAAPVDRACALLAAFGIDRDAVPPVA